MVEDGIEREVLEEIGRRLLAKKEELAKFLENKVENPLSIIESVTKSLNDMGLITNVSPIGKGCYVITQKGIRELL